jgi:hypothetical protein
MSGWLHRCRRCFTASILGRSLRVALIVGTILNLINQGDALFGSRKLNILKLLLTYAVPFCVCTYGAVSYRLSTLGPQQLSSRRTESG